MTMTWQEAWELARSGAQLAFEMNNGERLRGYLTNVPAGADRDWADGALFYLARERPGQDDNVGTEYLVANVCSICVASSERTADPITRGE